MQYRIIRPVPIHNVRIFIVLLFFNPPVWLNLMGFRIECT